MILGLNGENLWLLKREEFSFFGDHLDFRHELGKLVSESKSRPFFSEITLIMGMNWGKISG